MDLYEALYTTRAMRRVKPDPIPEETVRRILDAAIRGPSGGNSQQWRFLTVTDRQTMKALGELYADAFRLLQETIYAGRVEKARETGDDQSLRVFSSSEWLAQNFGDVPLVVFAYSRNDPTGASIYPAVWNLMLAARGEGIGTTLTTILGHFKGAEVAELLGVPADKGWVNNAAIPCGYPLGRWGVAKRAPVASVVYQEHWGKAPDWPDDGPAWSPPV